MANYQIITDSGCDLPVNMLAELDLKMVSLNLLFRGQTLEDSVNDDIRDMYAALRQGEAASTSAVNPQRWASVMEPVLQEGKDILVIAFSSGLSTTCQSAQIAAKELQEAYSVW